MCTRSCLTAQRGFLIERRWLSEPTSRPSRLARPRSLVADVPEPRSRISRLQGKHLSRLRADGVVLRHFVRPASRVTHGCVVGDR